MYAQKIESKGGGFIVGDQFWEFQWKKSFCIAVVVKYL